MRRNNMRRVEAFAGVSDRPLWKAFLGAVYLAGVNVFLIWLFNSMLIQEYHRLPTYREIFLGMLALPLYLWLWASGRSNRQHHHWAAEMCFGWYYGILPLLWVGRLFLQYGVLGSVLIFVEVLSLSIGFVMIILRPSWFEKFLNHVIGNLWILIIFMGGGPTGGALLGMYMARGGQIDYVRGILAIAFSVLGFIFALGTTYLQWSYRPWVRDYENAKS